MNELMLCQECGLAKPIQEVKENRYRLRHCWISTDWFDDGAQAEQQWNALNAEIQEGQKWILRMK